MKSRTNLARQYIGLTLALVDLMSGVTFLPGATRLAFAQSVSPGWSSTRKLNTARNDHTATLLPNGKVLVAGGAKWFKDGADFTYISLNSAELYDPQTSTWTYTGSLQTARWLHTATLLANGKVLVVGGTSDSLYTQESGPTLGSAELYDPSSGTWANTGSLITPRLSHTATLLQNGKVLVVGGSSSMGPPTKKEAELYDPTTGIWTSTGDLTQARSLNTATLLTNGQVLVLGGYSDNSNSGGFPISTELYDPATGRWSASGALLRDRNWHTATLLPSGRVLVAGGRHGDFGYYVDTELYDPATGTSASTGNLKTELSGSDAATLLPNGQVLLLGDLRTANAQLFDPTTGTWNLTNSMDPRRLYYSSTLLTNGKVLVAGGFLEGGENVSMDRAEVYDPGAFNQIDDAQFFVHQHYLDFLNREPDAGGLTFWTEQITGNSRNDPPPCPAGDRHCLNERRIGVSAAFFISLEFQDSGYYVYRFYKASFGRQPNYAEFTADHNTVIGGSNLDASKQAFADSWVQRTAFTQAYPVTMSNTEVVNKLFDSADLTTSTYDAQRQQEILAMNAGRSRALVLRDLIEIPDFKNIPDPNDPRYGEIKQTSQYNPAFVLMQYFAYLHRDLDRTGYDFWLAVVNNRDPNNYHGMVCSFITSSEYQLRFGSVVTLSNAECAQ